MEAVGHLGVLLVLEGLPDVAGVLGLDGLGAELLEGEGPVDVVLVVALRRPKKPSSSSSLQMIGGVVLLHSHSFSLVSPVVVPVTRIRTRRASSRSLPVVVVVSSSIRNQRRE